VVNPTPSLRTAEQELETFAKKLHENPDFVVTQCIYDAEKTLRFFDKSKIDQGQLYINLGYWRRNLPLARLGIYNPNKLIAPPQELVDFAIRNCKGIYVCGNHPDLDQNLEKQLLHAQKSDKKE
jgi:hypothetical protein